MKAPERGATSFVLMHAAHVPASLSIQAAQVDGVAEAPTHAATYAAISDDEHDCVALKGDATRKVEKPTMSQSSQEMGELSQ